MIVFDDCVPIYFVMYERCLALLNSVPILGGCQLTSDESHFFLQIPFFLDRVVEAVRLNHPQIHKWYE